MKCYPFSSGTQAHDLVVTPVFMNPKGTEHTDYQRKIDGYKALFEVKDGKQKKIPHDDKSVKVFVLLHTNDVDGLPTGYKRYWFDRVDKALTFLEGQ